MRWRAGDDLLEHRWENQELLARAVMEREAAESARTRAEQADEAKTRFLAAASHDLRQPVQALSLFSHVLASKPSPEELESATIAIGRSTNALQGMLEGLFDISRLDAGLVNAAPRSVELGSLTWRAVGFFALGA